MANALGYFFKDKEYILLDTFFEEMVDNNIIVKIAQKVTDLFKLNWENCLGISTDKYDPSYKKV